MSEAGRSLSAGTNTSRTVIGALAPIAVPTISGDFGDVQPGSPAGQRRVLVVAPQPMYEDRGTPIAVRNLLRALSHLKYQVDLVTYPVGRPLDIPGLRVVRAPNPCRIRHVPVGFSLRKLVLDATLVLTLWAQLARRRYACIHALEEAAFPAALLGAWYRTPVIYDMASSLPEQLVTYRVFRIKVVQRLLRACEAWLLRRVQLVVTSAGLLRRVVEVAPATPVREWHFPTEPEEAAPGATAALRRELGITASAPVVLYAGTFEPYQGLPLLLDSVREVHAALPNAVFVLVGGTGESAELMGREVARRGLNGGIRLLGRKPREQMPTYLGMADVLVSPRNYGDNLPLKIFDYLAAGRPIVATDVPAHRTVLDETRAILTERSASAMARGIVRVILQPDHSARLAAAGQAYAVRHLGWHRFVEAVSAVYKQVTPQADAPVPA